MSFNFSPPFYVAHMQKLIASKTHDHEGFHVLNTIVEALPLATYEQYMPTVWTLLFSRWEMAKRRKKC